jgi:ribosomal protein L29
MKRREELDKYHDLSEEELRAEAARLKESLFRLQFKLALGEVDAVKRIREEKKSLARLHTLTQQRQPQTSGRQPQTAKAPAAKAPVPAKTTGETDAPAT